MLKHVEQMLRQTFDAICEGVEAMDGTRFREDVLTLPGGTIVVDRILEDGNVFERAGMNFATVYTPLSPEMVRVAMGQHADPSAPPVEGAVASVTSLSLVIHPHNPHAPTAHANYRYFQLSVDGQPDSWWFGGGADLTPSYLYEEDASHFHQTLADACDRFDPTFYPRFKQQCDEYFYLPHRGERRGVGGIFFDTLNDRPAETLLEFVSACAASFVPSYLPIVERRASLSFTPEQKQWQGLRRGRYVEFNLIHDRGTTFGLKSDFVRPQSILMSLPLIARWTYDHHPAPGSPEDSLLTVLRQPRPWLEAATAPAYDTMLVESHI